MARKRRYEGQSWILAVALAGSPVLHLGFAVWFEACREVPKPRLFVDAAGEGAGTIRSVPEGIECGRDCVGAYDPGTEVKLSIVLQEGSTFKGWGEGCLPNSQRVFECTVVVDETKHIRPVFGLVPKKVDLKMENVAVDAEPRPAAGDDDERVTINLPDPEEEFEKLDIPIPEPDQPDEEEEKPPLVAKAPPLPAEEAPPPPKAKEVKPPPGMKAVEVPDEHEVEEAPDDAKFLSDKNRDVAEETRETHTNLEKQQKGDTVHSEKNDNTDDEVGADEDLIAQTDDVEETSLDAERVDETETRGNTDEGVVPHGEAGDDGESGQEGDGSAADKPGMLAMRGLDGRGPPGGPIVDEQRDPTPSGSAGRRGKRGKRGIKTQLTFQDYKQIVGKEIAKHEVELGKKRKSKRKGRWEKKQAAVKAALENFIPEVRPGNQTALKTRAAPFAVYVARMHRRIHELWGFGFLEELDGRSATDPLNNWKLQTIIEISINPDGTIHKTTIVSPSGVLRFDVAAIDVLYTAGPFDAPPEKIRSVDGRVYMHWVFRRDWEQCGTFNTRMFILNEVSEGKIDDGKMVREMKRRIGGSKRGSGEHAGASARALANLPAPDDPHAQKTANTWLAGFATKDVKKMVRVSGYPFQSGKHIIANSLTEIGYVYRNVLNETKGRIKQWKLLSPAGYRKAFGALPPGVDSGSDQLLMAVQAGKERFTLVLKRQSSGSYTIVAFHR